MADNVGYTPGTGATVAADEIAGVLHQRVKLGIGDDGVAVDVSATNPMPITAVTPLAVTTGGLTDTELRAAPLDVDITGIDPSVTLTVHDEDNHLQLSRIINALSAPQGYDRSLQRQRVTATLESGTVTTVTTITTVSAVTNLASIGGDQGQLLTRGSNLSAWRDCVRSLIS
jgi:hypothetical protein